MLLYNALRAAVLAVPTLSLLGTTAVAGGNGSYGGHPVFLQYEFGEYRYPEPAWAAGGISCKGGRWIAYHRGFDDVDPIDCHGRIFVYSGWWRGKMFNVHIDSKSGHVRGVSRG